MALYTNDKDLVLAYQSGDDGAFNEIAERYRPKLVSLATMRLRCQDAAEDAVQETLVRADRALPRFNGEYKLGPWLCRILENVCHDESKRQGREHAKFEKVAHSADFETISRSTPEYDLGLDVDHQGLQDALEQLIPNRRKALVLREAEQMSYYEVAEEMDITEENARALVSRAKSDMRKLLKVAAVVPVVGALLPLLGKLAAGTVLVASVLTPAGDSVQLPAPVGSEQLRTQTVVLEQSLAGATEQDLTNQEVLGPDANSVIGAERVLAGTSEETDAGSQTQVALSDSAEQEGDQTAAAASAGAAGSAESNGPAVAESPAATDSRPGAAPLARGAPYSIAGYNLSVIDVGTSALSLVGEVTIQTEAGFVDAVVSPRSRLSIAADPLAETASNQAKVHPLGGNLVIDLPDATVLQISLTGTATHFGSSLLVTQGTEMSIAVSFDSAVQVFETSEVTQRQALPITGAGNFEGTLVIDTRTSAAQLVLQRSS